MSETFEIEADVASVVEEAVAAFQGQMVEVLQSGLDGRAKWVGILADRRVYYDQGRRGDVVALRFEAVDREHETLEFPAAEVVSCGFGAEHGDAHPSLSVMTRTGLTLIAPEGAIQERYRRTTPPRAVLESPHFAAASNVLAWAWLLWPRTRIVVRDDRADEPLAGTFEGVSTGAESWTIHVGEHEVEIPFTDLQGARRIRLRDDDGEETGGETIEISSEGHRISISAG